MEVTEKKSVTIHIHVCVYKYCTLHGHGMELSDGEY